MGQRASEVFGVLLPLSLTSILHLHSAVLHWSAGARTRTFVTEKYCHRMPQHSPFTSHSLFFLVCLHSRLLHNNSWLAQQPLVFETYTLTPYFLGIYRCYMVRSCSDLLGFTANHFSLLSEFPPLKSEQWQSLAISEKWTNDFFRCFWYLPMLHGY